MARLGIKRPRPIMVAMGRIFFSYLVIMSLAWYFLVALQLPLDSPNVFSTALGHKSTICHGHRFILQGLSMNKLFKVATMALLSSMSWVLLEFFLG